MSERSIFITEKDGNYQLHNSVLNQFELIGLLEQIVFDLKTSKKGSDGKENVIDPTTLPAPEPIPEKAAAPAKVESPIIASDEPKETAPRIPGVTVSQAADLRTRINNAVKAIRDLDGKVDSVDLRSMTDAELQIELEGLTAQYKRLKKSKGK